MKFCGRDIKFGGPTPEKSGGPELMKNGGPRIE